MNSDSSWKILYALSAADILRNLPKDIQKRIVGKMRFFISTGNPMKYAETLKDKELGDFRFRIGNYRIIFVILGEKKIYVIKIGKRDEVYK